MRSWKFKIFFPIIVVTILAIAKYILWDFPISDGKRVGNLTKISKKGKIWPTWEGTIDEGSGDKLTTYFSVQSNETGEELYNYEGKQVIIYYEQYLVGWPRDTNYNVVSWKPKDGGPSDAVAVSSHAYRSGAEESLLSKTLFCALLGSIFTDKDLYQQVKSHVKENNLYLYKQISGCNE